MRRAASLILALTLLAGCTTATPGRASAAPVPSLGARPREIRLDGRDPCSLLTSAQAVALGLEDTSRQRFISVPPAPGPACSLSGFRPRAIRVALVLGNTTDLAALVQPGALSDELTLIAVRGFPSVLARPGDRLGCFLDISVAEGQVLDVEFGDGGRVPPISQDRLCRDVVGLGDQAMQTLLAG